VINIKAKIDKRLCKYCDFWDRENEGICLAKIMGGNCRFDR